MDLTDVNQAVGRWLREFASAIERHDFAGVQRVLDPDACWRDVLALTWDVHTFYGIEQITDALRSSLPESKPSAIDWSERSPPRRVVRACRTVIEAIFDFEVASGRGHGVVRLI